MTLGGLALAVGILVDDATVEIENIDRNLRRHGTLDDDASSTAPPRSRCRPLSRPSAFASSLCRFSFSRECEISLRAAGRGGDLRDAGFLSSFADGSSDLCQILLPPEMERHRSQSRPNREPSLAKSRSASRTALAGSGKGTGIYLSICLRHPKVTFSVCLVLPGFPYCFFPFLGEDFFPTVDAGRFDMHVRMKPGTRVEETARLTDEVEQMLRKIIPAGQLEGIIDNLGIPYSGINLSYNTSGTTSAADGDILVSLKEQHDPTNQFVREIRKRMPQEFPDVEFWFPPADIVAQILNFGLPAPINVQVQGLNKDANFAFASRLMSQMRTIPGLVDLRIQELNTVPRLDITVDRTKASILGMQEQNVANSVLGALAGSQQVNPNFWVDPKNGVTYSVTAQEPQYQMDSLDALRNLPILGGTGVTPQILANVAGISRSATNAVVDHYNIRPVINIYGNVDGKDLGYVSKQVQGSVDASKKDLPRGSLLVLRGQTKTMHFFFRTVLGSGLFDCAGLSADGGEFPVLARAVHYYHGLPCALAGIIWMLFITGTTLSVPALMGRSCAWAWPPRTAFSSSLLPTNSYMNCMTPTGLHCKPATCASDPCL